MLCYYRSRPSQFTVFLPTFPSLLFHGPSNPETNHLPRVLSKLISQGDPGNEFAPSLPRFCDTYISSLRLNIECTFHLLKKVIESASPSASPSPPPLSFTGDIIFTLLSSSLIDTTGCHVKHCSSPTRDSASPDSSFISLENETRLDENLVKVLPEKKGNYPPFSSPLLQF